MSRTRATLARVAARAGVSPSTASLAFSGAGPVAAATRERVLAAARELGYSGPDPLAQSLRRGRSGIVGAVVGDRLLHAFRDPVAVALLDGLAEELTPSGSGLLLMSGAAHRIGPTPEQVARLPVDVVVFATCGDDDDPLLDHFVERGVPVVVVDGPERDGTALLTVDDRAGTVESARHLAELGHTRVATVTLPLSSEGRRGWVDDDRRQAVRFAVCRERLAGVTDVFGPVPTVETAANLIEEGEIAARMLLAGRDVTAVMVQSDLLAVGVVRAAEELGLHVPEDLSVVGFDGIETPWLGERRLTTIAQPTTEKGRIAGRMVTDYLAGRRPESRRLPVQLIIADTTAPPSARTARVGRRSGSAGPNR